MLTVGITALDLELQAISDRLAAMPEKQREELKAQFRASCAAADDLKAAKAQLAAAQFAADTLSARWGCVRVGLDGYVACVAAAEKALFFAYGNVPALREAIGMVDAPFDPRLNLTPAAISDAAAALSRGDPSRLLLPLREMIDVYQARGVAEQQKAAQAVADATAAVVDAERRAAV